MINQILLDSVNLHYLSAAFKERSIKALIGRVFDINSTKERVQDIHALKNISLRIDPGERVGLLGSNGAGKSTFLKMIAGLYPTSSGSRIVNGTIRALFDLSLGFEPDASGRENILYRGLLLGLSPKEIKNLEEEIITFTDIGEFIDYPLKTYSAGMQVRLAFAISTAVHGDILLLDEVIGVGDLQFLEKAKARISKIVERSEILILASHDLTALSSICSRGIVLDHGNLVFDSNIDEAINFYKNRNITV
ncbi:ABC transporter ATP-binding protein [uncultured Thiothrix sp.]|uniref:ABC transporter ATP-binding protein n=1 Tax=uncultured Thiothrix sp. TaxID=223185 RepID=UPI0026183D4A|nr:ABC transporter ATP-binding protein [uncultured Thiothrix sp.]